MKLFVWANPYPVYYGSSGLFAVAETEEQARQIAESAPVYSYIHNEKTSPEFERSLIKLGPPTRVVDLPCAEWHEWSE